ncbi:MAG: glutathione S-transferase family protein [Woeseiaceae bacterium]
MGSLVDGKWVDHWRDTKSTGGHFVRPQSMLRNWITADGDPGPSGDGGFKAESGRYHLYIASSCPWAHRTMVFRKLKGLEDMISTSVVNPIAHSDGWTFHDGHGVIADPINNAEFLYEVYLASDPSYTGRVTVPTLWDKQQATIVCNESSEIIRMFNSAFDGVGAKPGDYYPEHLRADIDEINEFVYVAINNGVYRTGFATSDEAYEESFNRLFDALDTLEERLKSQKYLVGDTLTEADWRLFTTLIRFDLAYYGPFKCNKKRLIDYPNLWDYTRSLYQVPGISETVDPFSIKQHYYSSSKMMQPTGIVGLGPDIDFQQPTTR